MLMEDAGIATYPKTAETRGSSDSIQVAPRNALSSIPEPWVPSLSVPENKKPPDRKRADVVSISLAPLMLLMLYHTAARASV